MTKSNKTIEQRIQEIKESNIEIAVYMEQSIQNLKQLNDNNILHCQETSKDAVEIKTILKGLGTYVKWLITLLFLVTGAVIILAGAEKIFTYVKLPI